jgi:hypothetical protein
VVESVKQLSFQHIFGLIMRKILACSLWLFVACAYLAAQNNPGWLRYPAISPDGKTIVFTYKGDLYRVAGSGGTATPLTTHEAHDFMPVWSHDGKHLAFASDRYGNFDIFIIPAEGGEAKRVTYHSAQEYPHTFSNDDKSILFGAARMDSASSRTFPTNSQPELYKVPADGGRVEQVLTTPAEDVKLSKNGQYLIYQDKKGGENAWRKHHTMLIRLLPKRGSAIISALCSPIFRSRRRSRTSCGFSRMTQRVRRTWRRSGGPKASPASTVVGMANRAASRTAPPSCFDVATASMTLRSQPTRSCSAHIRRFRSGFGPRTSCRAKRSA